MPLFEENESSGGKSTKKKFPCKFFGRKMRKNIAGNPKTPLPTQRAGTSGEFFLQKTVCSLTFAKQ